MKKCKNCGTDISYLKSNNAQRCAKCARKNLITAKVRKNIQEKVIPMKKKTNGYSFSEIVLWSHDYKCAVCGWSIAKILGSESKINLTPTGKTIQSNGLEIHHIIPIKQNGKNEYDNVIPLCPNCHKLADYGYLSVNRLKNSLPNQKTPEEINDIINDSRLKRRTLQIIDGIYD